MAIAPTANDSAFKAFKDVGDFWMNRGFGGAQVPGANLVTIPPPSYDQVAAVEPYGSTPELLKARLSGWGEPARISYTLDASRLQSIFTAAERGQTTQLYTYYRDLICNGGHISAEFSKRKLVIVGQELELVPARPGNKDDEEAAEVCGLMIEQCENWQNGLIHLLDASLYPVSVNEKIFAPGEDGLMFKLDKIEPVNYQLLCHWLPYLVPGSSGITPPLNYNNPVALPSGPVTKLLNPDTVWNPDDWEADLRFWRTYPNGMIDFSPGNVYRADPARHLIHRGHFMAGIRDNYGGPMRGVAVMGFILGMGRDWFCEFIERYGMPFTVVKVDAENVDAVRLIQQAMNNAIKWRSLMLDKDATAEIKEVQTGRGASAHEAFLNFFNREISKLILGQELSSTAKGTGLGSGVADLQSQVRDDIRRFDMMMLSSTLRKYLFGPFLRMNGFMKGQPPKPVWGGQSMLDAVKTSEVLKNIKLSGCEPTDDALTTISERLGFDVQRAPEPQPELPGMGGKPNGNGNGNGKPKANGEKTKKPSRLNAAGRRYKPSEQRWVMDRVE